MTGEFFRSKRWPRRCDGERKVWWRVHGQVDQNACAGTANDHPAEGIAVIDPLHGPTPLADRSLQCIARDGTCPRSGAVKKSRSSVARDVRCCASRAPPPARRKPLLAGRAKNSLANSSWKADRSGRLPPATTPLPRCRARSAAPTQTEPRAAKQGLATSQPAARHRRKPGCRRAFPLAGRSRTPGPGRPWPEGRTRALAPTSSSAAATPPPPAPAPRPATAADPEPTPA